jgi:hypothetical protein
VSAARPAVRPAPHRGESGLRRWPFGGIDRAGSARKTIDHPHRHSHGARKHCGLDQMVQPNQVRFNSFSSDTAFCNRPPSVFGPLRRPTSASQSAECPCSLRSSPARPQFKKTLGPWRSEVCQTRFLFDALGVPGVSGVSTRSAPSRSTQPLGALAALQQTLCCHRGRLARLEFRADSGRRKGWGFATSEEFHFHV